MLSSIPRYSYRDNGKEKKKHFNSVVIGAEGNKEMCSNFSKFKKEKCWQN